MEEGVYANLESNSDTTSTNTKVGHILFQTSMPKEAVKFDTEKSRSFFDMETKTLGSGGRHLVAQSFYRGDRKPQDLEEEDVEICLQMTILVQSLSLRQNKLLGNFMTLLFGKIERISCANFKKNVHDQALADFVLIAAALPASRHAPRPPKPQRPSIFLVFLLCQQLMEKSDQ